MSRVQKLKLNTIFSILNQFVTLFSGLIIPRYLLINYGSDINGLVSSISQFLSFITFLEMGVGTVIQSALYAPLYNNDMYLVSEILVSARKFFNKIARSLFVYVIILLFIFPVLVDSPISILSTILLIVSISISTFAQYYFGIINQLLLNTDQKSYVYLIVQMISTTLNIISSYYLMSMQLPIEFVRLVTSLIFLLRPIFQLFYVKENYKLYIDEVSGNYQIPQIWNGAAQHIAYTIMNSTDSIILSLFSSLENVSIYSVYNLIFNGIKLFLNTIALNFRSFFGNLIAEDNRSKTFTYFNYIEWGFHSIITIIFVLTILLINSFVKIYTTGVNDVNYYVPIFSTLMTIATALYCYRLPYNSMIFAAGHFKQTQNSSIIEAVINLLLSILLVRKYGIVGVAVGTLCAILYRLIYLIIYLSRNIIHIKIYRTTSLFINDIIIVLVTILFSNIVQLKVNNYIDWFIVAIIYGLIAVFNTVLLNYIFNKKYLLYVIRKIR